VSEPYKAQYLTGVWKTAIWDSWTGSWLYPFPISEAGRGDDRAPASNFEIKNVWSYTAILHPRDLVLEVKHSDSFTYPCHGYGMQQLVARGVVYFILPDLKIISAHNKFFN